MTGWGTMLPTFSTPSRNLCITVFETAPTVDMDTLLCSNPPHPGRDADIAAAGESGRHLS